jgi:hypothetical protein
MNERYYVVETVARNCIQSKKILPLLDGLDQPGITHRQSCVEAVTISDMRMVYVQLPSVAVLLNTTALE